MAEALRRGKAGFTLVEIITCAAIILAVMALAYPAFAGARERSRRATCLSNMRQLWLAVEQYRNDQDGSASGDLFQMGLPSYSALTPIFLSVNVACPDYDRKRLSGYIYVPNEPQIQAPLQWSERVARYGSSSFLFIDVGHNDRDTSEDPYAVKVGLGVRLDGRAVSKSRAGDIENYRWWQEPWSGQ